MTKKGWLCRHGFHRQIYIDSAFFAAADRCGVCHDWIDPDEGAEVERFLHGVAVRVPELGSNIFRQDRPPS